MLEIKISYSWGDEETPIPCDTNDKEEVWKEMKKMAVDEAEICSEEHECFIGILCKKDKGKITLHYAYDNEFCYYELHEK